MGVNKTTEIGMEKDKFFLPFLKEKYVADPLLGVIKNKKTGQIVGRPPHGKYGSLGFRYKGKVIFFNTHKVMWLLCKGLIPVGFVINHKDGVKSNTILTNLEIVPEQTNRIHAHENGLVPPPNTSGTLNGNSKFSIEDVLRIRNLINHMSCADIAKIFEVSRTTIHFIKHNKTYTDSVYYANT